MQAIHFLVVALLCSDASSARINGRHISLGMEMSKVRAIAGAPQDRSRGKWVYQCRSRDWNCRPASDGAARTIVIEFSDQRVRAIRIRR